MARFTDKVCIVTGGASGIGARTALMFAEQGGKVVIGDVNDELGTEICQEMGADVAVYMHLDVTDPEACQKAVDLAVELFGGVDCVVNSAVKMGAIAPPNRPPSEIILLAVPRLETGIQRLTILALVG